MILISWSTLRDAIVNPFFPMIVAWRERWMGISSTTSSISAEESTSFPLTSTSLVDGFVVRRGRSNFEAAIAPKGPYE